MFFSDAFFCKNFEVNFLVLPEFGDEDILMYEFDLFKFGELVSLGYPPELVGVD